MDNRDVLIKEISENIIEYALATEIGDFLLTTAYQCYTDAEVFEICNEAVVIAKEEYRLRYGREIQEGIV